MDQSDAGAPVLAARDGGVLVVTLNRPDKLNSFNEAMHAELRKALDIAENDAEVRCVLLTGAGRGFCAGQDLSDRMSTPDAPPPDLTRTIEANYNPLVRRLKALPKPVVCAVNGVAAGPAPTSRSPATSSSPPKVRSSFRRSPGSGLFPTAAEPGRCRILSGLLGPRRLQCSQPRCPRNRRSNGA